MNARYVPPFVIVAFAVVLIAVFISDTSNSQEPPQVNKPATTPQVSSTATSDGAKGLEVLKSDAGTWDAVVSHWPQAGSEPIESRAVVTAQMAVGGMYLEQRSEGTFGPETGNKAWSTLSYTHFNATDGVYETVRMANSDSPMIVVRGKAIRDEQKGVSMELTGEYMLKGSRATERDVIRHEGPDSA